MFSYLSQACGAAFAGFYISLTSDKEKDIYTYHHIVLLYSAFGLLKVLCYRSLSQRV